MLRLRLHKIALIETKKTCNVKTDFSDSTFFILLSSEHEEIEKLKWLESEKVHHDIGQRYAILLWIRYHRQKWIDGQHD